MASLPLAVTVPDPVCLDDFALLPASRHKLESLLDQTLPFPSTGVNGLVLFGLHGTGKTTLARLLPGLLETAKVDPASAHMAPGALVDTQSPNDHYNPCQQGQNGLTLIQVIESTTSFVAWNASGLHYVILDEVDLLTAAAMTSFKSVMNRKNVVFIMTTNHLEKIDLTPPSDAVLDQVVQAGRGSARSIFSDVLMSANQARRAGQAQVAKISNIRS